VLNTVPKWPKTLSAEVTQAISHNPTLPHQQRESLDFLHYLLLLLATPEKERPLLPQHSNHHLILQDEMLIRMRIFMVLTCILLLCMDILQPCIQVSRCIVLSVS
jgi:hypothetical protein